MRADVNPLSLSELDNVDRCLSPKLVFSIESLMPNVGSGCEVVMKFLEGLI
jgi:hypothetical protein